ncbi:hypothetical protein LCM20_05750 [Halobacillus litoralis]|uniref:hypothetical protein n=1 Tax=Halobacillus litoralis TaxID=45668 RepID=UPI001CD1C834|nr:hypothetical protein [Halobacillus litoralis]MCA0970081.1 hypothetical protein [Halobacillus litoralis]
MKGINWMVAIGAALIGAYRFRYRLINTASSYPLLRKALVRLTMNIPYLRKKLLGHMFQSR